ncbi:folylpolyglutamate synthase/dihydrofolate synthase family protein [Propionimicrobium sp. PCR01-08-3]|uniref:bifunctional folylpolyglutamate synthase/dihydrofolate synthase n=1 Tax=Propionimicrobium sp. PCR01-08-3 TaxID=3052086 RepID=UPI00255C9825|nr:folylpolyglutamate synthase/dihydrofolate synthase family protein [Propionimicrobium sp. PCR01-08-3]WIY83509.1 folylpolyglutamate synthase/dihydrofolate synthase family protein [Propionimicrobium sp. PCR01-08-3]
MSSLAQPSIHAGHDELVDWLIGRWPESHPQPSLERIQALCDLLGDPQRACPVIQITGTNGKGSTAIMIEGLLRAMGLRTGRFSSPHLEDVTERIAIDGEPISAERFDEIWYQIAPMVQMVDDRLIGGVPLTFFEVITGMAYAAFADAPVDVAIMEVGMGGRWDATSVADAQVAVVAPISLDHTHLLGNTIAQIAGEKSGIIKHGSVAVLADQVTEAAAVLMKRCFEVGVPAKWEGTDFGLVDRQLAVGGQVIRIETADGPMGDIFLPLHGEYMARNAALAVAAAEAFRGSALSGEVISEGLGIVKAPARLEAVGSDPLVVLDTAHNTDAVAATLAGMREAFTAQPLIGVVAMMRDKPVPEVMGLLAQELDTIVVTTMPGNQRAMPVAEIQELAEETFEPGQVRAAATPALAIDLARGLAEQGGDEAAVLVIGSVYLAGEIREILEKLQEELGL